jgi:hypothetical protein
MKRRNFVLSGGTLATISLTLTGTMAGFVDSVTANANFQIVPNAGDVETKLETIPTSANQPSTHTWEFTGLEIEADVDTITVVYPTGTSFDGLSNKEITVELDRSGDGSTKEVKVNKDTYGGRSATFDLAGNFNTNIMGTAVVTIEGIENPDGGIYEPELSFETATETFSFTAEMGITDDTAFYEPEIIDAPSVVTAGDSFTADYTVTNTGNGPGNQTITVSAGDSEESTTKALDSSDSYSDTFSYTTSEADSPAVDLVVATEDTTATQEITVAGAWSLDLNPAKQNSSSIHTWTTGFVDYQGEVDEIRVNYPGGKQGASLDGLTNEDVTVEITRDGENSPTDIRVNSDTYAGSTATFDLSGNFNTDIDGEVIVRIDGVENPKKGDYSADITLIGNDQTTTYTVSFYHLISPFSVAC